MPSSKEVRTRQNRQKERVAALHVERQRTRKRRQQIAVSVGVILLVALVGVGFAIGNNDTSNDKVAVVPTSAVPRTSTVPTSTTPTSAVAQKACVGLKQALPKGSPAMPIEAGPAPTKLITKDLKVGTGAVVPGGGKVTVNYVGVACTTGKIFDSTYAHNQPFDADLSGALIDGWKQGIPGMKIGGVRLLSIPSNLGYGAHGQAPIKPNEALFFLVSAVKAG